MERLFATRFRKIDIMERKIKPLWPTTEKQIGLLRDTLVHCEWLIPEIASYSWSIHPVRFPPRNFLNSSATWYSIFLVKPKVQWIQGYFRASRYVHYGFTIYSLHVHYMFTIYSLCVHSIFTTCSLYVHCKFTICSPYFHFIFTTFSLYIHCEKVYWKIAPAATCSDFLKFSPDIAW